MKKLLLISIFLGSIILNGCGVKQGLSQEELFEKKQECVKYKEGLRNEISKYQNEIEGASGYYLETITEIFYSPSKNSCFATTDERSSRDHKEYRNYVRIIDLLTNQKTNYNKNNHDDMVYFNERIKELKGE